MRWCLRKTGMLAGIIVMCCVMTQAVFAQNRGGERAPMKIRKITGDKVRTPEYKIIGGTAQGKTRNWYRVRVNYETYPDWMDELKVRYYILVKNKKKKGKLTLFSGIIDYVNIAKGNQHRTEAFLHPSTLERYGEVESIAVEFIAQGKPVARGSRPESKQRWWENYTPMGGYVLSRLESPFAMINFDDYEAIKASAPGR